MDAVFQAISSETLVCIRFIVMQLNSVCFSSICLFLHFSEHDPYHSKYGCEQNDTTTVAREATVVRMAT